MYYQIIKVNIECKEQSVDENEIYADNNFHLKKNLLQAKQIFNETWITS